MQREEVAHGKALWVKRSMATVRSRKRVDVAGVEDYGEREGSMGSE